MRKSVFLISLIGSLSLQASDSASQIVYGQDNRVDIHTLKNPQIRQLAKAIAGRVENNSFKLTSSNGVIDFGPISQLSDPRGARVCSTERFSEQASLVDCTGFLVGEDLLATAGHCVLSPGQDVKNETSRLCDNFSWVFDYTAKTDLNAVNTQNIYGCDKILRGKYTEEVDYALIKLKRKVVGREPLKLAKRKPYLGQSIFVMGHPSGLPLKYADGARVFENKRDYFGTNLDTFGGNSGSPVFNAQTFEVLGILVRGDTDYVMSSDENGDSCRKVNTCDDNRENCEHDDSRILGEHVSFISFITKAL